MPIESSKLQLTQTLAAKYLHWYCSPPTGWVAPSCPAKPIDAERGAPLYALRSLKFQQIQGV